MAESFPSQSAPCNQSTPNPSPQLVPQAGQDPSGGQDAVEDSAPSGEPVPCVAPNSGQEQLSLDSGVFLNISSISESTDPCMSWIPPQIGAEAEIPLYPGHGEIEDIYKEFPGPVEENQLEQWPLLSEVRAVCQEMSQHFSTLEQPNSQQGQTDGNMEENSDPGCL